MIGENRGEVPICQSELVAFFLRSFAAIPVCSVFGYRLFAKRYLRQSERLVLRLFRLFQKIGKVVLEIFAGFDGIDNGAWLFLGSNTTSTGRYHRHAGRD